MKQELQDYIKKSKEAGFSNEQIKQELLKVGWKEEDVNQEFGGASIPAPIPTPGPTSNSTSTKKGIIYYYLAVLKKYAVFSGRARRKEYWMFILFSAIISLVISIMISIIGSTIIKGNAANAAGILVSIYALAVLIPSIAVAIRRLHDTNRSGWWLFIDLIPFVGFIILLVFMVQDSQPGENKYGPDPKEIKVA